MPDISQRLGTEDRVAALVQFCNEHGIEPPDVETIALITGARSYHLVKAVLFDAQAA